MTELMQKAVQCVSKLSEGEQDRLAQWLLAELESEGRWASSFAESQGMLSEMADEALAELQAGKTQPLDPETL